MSTMSPNSEGSKSQSWYYADAQGKPHGPISLEELKRLAAVLSRFFLRPLCFYLLCFLPLHSTVHAADTLTPATLNAMNNLSIFFREVHPAPSPFPNPRSYDYRKIKEQQEVFDRLLADLRKLDKDAEKSTRRGWNGKPFFEALKDAQATIQANQTALAKEPPSEAYEIMVNLSRVCLKIKPLPSPLPQPNSHEVQEFEMTAQSVLGFRDELRKIDTEAEKSNRIFFDQPFAETLQIALDTIASNQATIQKMPDGEALSKIDAAIDIGKIGAKWMVDPKKFNATFSGMVDLYKSYELNKKHAIELDPKVLEFRKEELKKCDEGFVVPFLVLQDKREREEAIRKDIAEKASLPKVSKTKPPVADGFFRVGWLGAFGTLLTAAIGSWFIWKSTAPKKTKLIRIGGIASVALVVLCSGSGTSHRQSGASAPYEGKSSPANTGTATRLSDDRYEVEQVVTVPARTGLTHNGDLLREVILETNRDRQDKLLTELANESVVTTTPMRATIIDIDEEDGICKIETMSGTRWWTKQSKLKR